MLEQYGGHAAAAGFTIKASNVLKLQEKLNSLAAQWLLSDNTINRISPECYISFKDLTEKFFDDYTKLEPFGIGNPYPLFWTRKCLVLSSKKGYFGQIILRLENTNNIVEAIQWKSKNTPPKEGSIALFKDKTWRNFFLNEPRGGVFKHCNLIVKPSNKSADAGFIIMEPEDNPPMSGSNSICVATVLPYHDPHNVRIMLFSCRLLFSSSYR